MRAAIAAESAGIPSVSIVCDGFDGQALATSRGMGYDHMPLAVTVGHVDSQSIEELSHNFRSLTVERVISGLVGRSAHASPVAVEPASLDIVVSGTIDDINHHFVEQGWSDGHPVMPPTVDRVEAFLDGSGHDPWKVLGTAASSGRDLTVWSIAVNAVMAGCRPDYLPILLALTEILTDPRYGAEHSGNTTGADALIVLHGPSMSDLGFNSGPGALREGVHANSSVGRWLRLYLRNVFGFTSTEHDKATFGNATRIALTEDFACLAEIGWDPIGAEFGFSRNDDVVTMARMNSGIIIGSVFGATPNDVIPYLANGIARTASWDLSHVYGLGVDQFQPLLVLSPLLARLMAEAGWSKNDVQQALFEKARIPAVDFERFIGAWSNLTAGKRTLIELVSEGLVPEVYAISDDPDRLVPIVTGPERIMVAVAGDETRANAFAFSNDGPHGWWTAKRIDFSPGDDLDCRVVW